VEVDEAQHGGRKRMAAASAAGPPVPGAGDELGRGGDSDGRGLNDHSADAPPSRFRGGSLLPPLVNVLVDGDGLTVRGD